MTPSLSKPSGVGESERLGLSSSAPDLGELLLNAKLRVPRLRGGTVSRVDLVQRARSSGCRVVGITAPAGYGKSTLLAEWAECEDRRVAGVSFDRFDDDPMALLVLLASAYARIDPGGADLRVEVRGVGMSVLGRAAPRLAAAFGACPVPFVLLLDDVHELRSPDCHDVLGLVIAGIPDGSQLVAASRWEQPHLPRLRVSGDALALDAGRSGARRYRGAADLLPGAGQPDPRGCRRGDGANRRLAGGPVLGGTARGRERLVDADGVR